MTHFKLINQHKKLLPIFIGLFMLAFFALFINAHAAELNSKEMESLKQQFLNDEQFINSIKNKINDDVSKTEVKNIVREYLLENPEVLIEVQQALTQKQELLTAKKQAQTLKTRHDAIFNYPMDATLGNPNGSITLVEFYDYNCGYCKRAQPSIESLIKKNPQLRIVLKDLPILGDDSVKAHIVAQAFLKLMPEKYAEYHDKLLLTPGVATQEKALQVALSLGVDEKQLKTAMADPIIQTPLAQNMQIAYDLNITGTPTFILGDEIIVGAVGEEALQQRITAYQNR